MDQRQWPLWARHELQGHLLGPSEAVTGSGLTHSDRAPSVNHCSSRQRAGFFPTLPGVRTRLPTWLACSFKHTHCVSLNLEKQVGLLLSILQKQLSQDKPFQSAAALEQKPPGGSSAAQPASSGGPSAAAPPAPSSPPTPGPPGGPLSALCRSEKSSRCLPSIRVCCSPPVHLALKYLFAEQNVMRGLILKLT